MLTYQQWAETELHAFNSPNSTYMLISYGTLIHGYPGARDGIQSVFAIPKLHIIFYDRIRV